jgi:hypothetical protein
MIKFTYLDLVDPTISFVPTMGTNWFEYQGNRTLYLQRMRPNDVLSRAMKGHGASWT